MKFPRGLIDIGEGCIAQERLSPAKKPTGKPRMATKSSRPSILHDGERWLSARLSYCLNREPIPCQPESMKEGLILHTCDNPSCINPDHLYLGDSRQNCIDRSRRSEGYRESRGKFTEKGLESLSEAASRRKGEKRPNSWWKTPEGREQNARNHRGKKRSDESREKMSKAMKESWKRRRGSGCA